MAAMRGLSPPQSGYNSGRVPAAQHGRPLTQVIWSKLDLEKGYLQVPVCKEDIPKMAIITPFGLSEFTHEFNSRLSDGKCKKCHKKQFTLKYISYLYAFVL
jgi:hypothetical protein